MTGASPTAAYNGLRYCSEGEVYRLAFESGAFLHGRVLRTKRLTSSVTHTQTEVAFAVPPSSDEETVVVRTHEVSKTASVYRSGFCGRHGDIVDVHGVDDPEGVEHDAGLFEGDFA